MSTPQRAPRSRSAFAAAFLSLLFPGLGHAYEGAYTRALGFAAVPLLLLALGGGVVLRTDRGELAGMVANDGARSPSSSPTSSSWSTGSSRRSTPGRSPASSTLRTPPAVDAWGAPGCPLNPLSIVGLVAVILVIAAGHVAIARYDVMATDWSTACSQRMARTPAATPPIRPPPSGARGRRTAPIRARPRIPPRPPPRVIPTPIVRPGHAGTDPAALGRQGTAEHPRGRGGRPGEVGTASTRTP